MMQKYMERVRPTPDRVRYVVRILLDIAIPNYAKEFDITFSDHEVDLLFRGKKFHFSVSSLADIENLIVMEGSLWNQNLDLDSALRRVGDLIKKTKKAEGEFVFLFHNTYRIFEKKDDFEKFFIPVMDFLIKGADK